MQPIRTAPTQGQADEWALVLTAAGIPNAVESEEDGWLVLAAPDDSVRAHALLAAYEEERRAPVTAPATEPYPWMSGVALGLLLLWLHSVTSGRPWSASGAAAAGPLLSGEVWRAVTALTLHADVVHVAGNALAAAVLVPPLVQRFGAGVTLLLLLVTGALGNVLAALVHDARHVAVGSSTAIFGAVGMLATLGFVPRATAPTRKQWTAPVAGVVLLTMLGAARGADLAAHAFGFAVGAVVGFLAGKLLGERARPLVQWAFGALTALTILLSWTFAVR